MTNKTIFKKFSAAILSITLALFSGAYFAQPASAAVANTVPASFTLSSGVVTYTQGTWSGGTGTTSSNPLWLICDNAYTAQSGVNGSSGTNPPSDCGPYAETDQSGSHDMNNPPAWVRPVVGTPTILPGTAWRWVSSNGSAMVTTLQSLNGKYVAIYENYSSNWVMSETQALSGLTGGATPPAPAAPSIPIPTLATESQSAIVSSVVGENISANGGRLVLRDLEMEKITTVTLNGKELQLIKSKSGTAIRIPAKAQSLLESLK